MKRFRWLTKPNAATEINHGVECPVKEFYLLNWNIIGISLSPLDSTGFVRKVARTNERPKTEIWYKKNYIKTPYLLIAETCDTYCESYVYEQVASVNINNILIKSEEKEQRTNKYAWLCFVQI